MKLPFRRIYTRNEDLSRVQNAVEQSLNPILDSVIIDGVLVTGVLLTTTATQVSHTLERNPLGYIVVGQDKHATFYSPVRDSRTITLLSSASNTTVDLWVF